MCCRGMTSSNVLKFLKALQGEVSTFLGFSNDFPSYIYIYVYIGSSRLLEPHTMGWGVGWDVNVHLNLRQQLMLRTRGVGGRGGMLTFMWTWGRMLTFMWTCGSSWCYAHAGWGGWGGDVNVHVNLRLDVNIHANLQQQLMMMWWWWWWW